MDGAIHLGRYAELITYQWDPSRIYTQGAAGLLWRFRFLERDHEPPTMEKGNVAKWPKKADDPGAGAAFRQEMGKRRWRTSLPFEQSRYR